VLGVGYDFVDRVLGGDAPVKAMLLLLALKLVATPVCYSSGNAGGIFGPSLFIGAMIGGSVGGAAHSLLPKITANPGAYALVGMGTAFAGIVRTPLTSVIMIFEMTRDYAIIVPLMISNLISFFISRRLQPEPIYEALALQEGVYLPSAEEHEDLAGMRVGEILDRSVEMLPLSATLEQAANFLKQRGCNSWPAGEAASVRGVVTLHQLETASPGAKTVRDLLPAGSDFPHLHTDHPASRVLDRMRGRGVDAMPVVSRADIHELLGVVTLGSVLTAYGIHTEGEKAVLS
jgi:CIC family chloride channel protein